MNCKKCGNLMEPGDVFCRKCEAPIDPTTQSMPSGVPISQTKANGINQNKQSSSNAIIIALIVIIAMGIVSLLIWQLVFGGTKGKLSSDSSNSSSEIKKIVNQKKSSYSIVGTWEGFALDSILEITITNSLQCTINAIDDFYEYDINTLEAEIVDGNILKIYSQTVQGPNTELRTTKFNEPIELYFLAVSKDKAIMTLKKGSEYVLGTPSERKGHRISTGEGILGEWTFKENDGDSTVIEFTNQEKCDLDSSGKCYKTIKVDDSIQSSTYYDDNFIYTYINAGDVHIEGWDNKLFGMMMYGVDGDELNISTLSLLNKKQ